MAQSKAPHKIMEMEEHFFGVVVSHTFVRKQKDLTEKQSSLNYRLRYFCSSPGKQKHDNREHSP